MQILIDARTVSVLVKSVAVIRRYLLLIGANQRMIRCSQFVGKEQMVPNRNSTMMARRTVWCAFLPGYVSYCENRLIQSSYGT
jgi:hypothetical protein